MGVFQQLSSGRSLFQFHSEVNTEATEELRAQWTLPDPLWTLWLVDGDAKGQEEVAEDPG